MEIPSVGTSGVIAPKDFKAENPKAFLRATLAAFTAALYGMPTDKLFPSEKLLKRRMGDNQGALGMTRVLTFAEGSSPELWDKVDLGGSLPKLETLTRQLKSNDGVERLAMKLGVEFMERFGRYVLPLDRSAWDGLAKAGDEMYRITDVD
jgi:hypothetical protein